MSPRPQGPGGGWPEPSGRHCFCLGPFVPPAPAQQDWIPPHPFLGSCPVVTVAGGSDPHSCCGCPFSLSSEQGADRALPGCSVCCVWKCFGMCPQDSALVQLERVEWLQVTVRRSLSRKHGQDPSGHRITTADELTSTQGLGPAGEGDGV